MMAHCPKIMLLVPLALLACGGERIEKTYTPMEADPAPKTRISASAATLFSPMRPSPVAKESTPITEPSDIIGAHQAFEAIERESDPDFFLKLLETPNAAHSVRYMGTEGEFHLLRIVIAASALSGPTDEKAAAKTTSDDESEPDNGDAEIQESTGSGPHPEITRILRARDASLNAERLKAAIETNQQIHAAHGFARLSSLPSTEEVIFLAELDKKRANDSSDD